jgi:hypothetical protein
MTRLVSNHGDEVSVLGGRGCGHLTQKLLAKRRRLKARGYIDIYVFLASESQRSQHP